MFGVRAKAGRWSLLALFALGLQFAASFGHIHAEAFASRTQPHISLAHGTGPADADHDLDAICSICTTVAISNMLVDAGTPVLPVPAVFTRTELSLPLNHQLAPIRHEHFRSRAPPLS